MTDGANIAQLEQDLLEQAALTQSKKENLDRLKREHDERERQSVLMEIEHFTDDAKNFRLEASRATTEADREVLRGYAKECEARANVLRKAIGLVEQEQEAQPQDEEEGHRAWLARQIWGNFNISLIFLSVWFGLYWVGEGTTGTVGYIAQVLSKPAFHAFLLFAGLLFVFLVIRRYFYNVTKYLNNRAAGVSFALDFQEASLSSRLFFVLGLLYVITQFLAAIYQITL